MVDDSHAAGFVGASGRGTPEHCGVVGRVDILTGTLGKALGGAQRRLHERPRGDRRLAAAALAAVSVLQQHPARDRRGDAARARPGRASAGAARARCSSNARHFRSRHDAAGLQARARRASDHPGDARRRARSPRDFADGCSTRASTSSASPSRSCRRARRASARRCRPAHRRADSNARSRAFEQGRAASSGHRESIMKALVKGEARARHLDGGHADADGRPERRADQGRARPRSAAPTCTSTTGTTGRRRPIPVPMAVGHEYYGEIVEIGSEVRGFSVGDRVSGEGHITCGYLPQLSRRPAAPVPQHRGRRREPPGLFRRVPGDPGVQRVQAAGRDHRRDRAHPRSARQRDAHRARRSTWSARTC